MNLTGRSIHLDAVTVERLKEHREKTGVPIAVAVRRAVEGYLEEFALLAKDTGK